MGRGDLPPKPTDVAEIDQRRERIAHLMAIAAIRAAWAAVHADEGTASGGASAPKDKKAA